MIIRGTIYYTNTNELSSCWLLFSLALSARLARCFASNEGTRKERERERERKEKKKETREEFLATYFFRVTQMPRLGCREEREKKEGGRVNSGERLERKGRRRRIIRWFASEKVEEFNRSNIEPIPFERFLYR